MIVFDFVCACVLKETESNLKSSRAEKSIKHEEKKWTCQREKSSDV